MRNSRDVTADPKRPDDRSREDTIGVDPGESVIIYRGFQGLRRAVRRALPQPAP